jgi:hypothetical protein
LPAQTPTAKSHHHLLSAPVYIEGPKSGSYMCGARTNAEGVHVRLAARKRAATCKLKLLFDSGADPANPLGNFVKFSTPVVVNGRVCVGTCNIKVVQYDYLPVSVRRLDACEVEIQRRDIRPRDHRSISGRSSRPNSSSSAVTRSSDGGPESHAATRAWDDRCARGRTSGGPGCSSSSCSGRASANCRPWLRAPRIKLREGTSGTQIWISYHPLSRAPSTRDRR